jgi:uncharacterized protein (TIGR00255 family)
MTGFARREGGDGTLTWLWELKSVNGRGLDLRCRIPAGYEGLEPAARAMAPRHCARGNLQIILTVSRGEGAQRYQVNRALLDQLVGLTRELEGEIEAAPPRLDGLLAVRGVVEAAEEEESREQREARTAAIEKDLVLAFEALAAARRAEGEQLLAIITGRLDEIERLTGAAGETAALQPEALRERLRSQVAELLEASPALPEERLAQEAALLITKADVREELDRLAAHIETARADLAKGGPVGRRLDFLCQEFNREANTLCSKAWDVELNRIGLDLKTAVDQLREQVQNVE